MDIVYSLFKKNILFGLKRKIKAKIAFRLVKFVVFQAFFYEVNENIEIKADCKEFIWV